MSANPGGAETDSSNDAGLDGAPVNSTRNDSDSSGNSAPDNALDTASETEKAEIQALSDALSNEALPATDDASAPVAPARVTQDAARFRKSEKSYSKAA
ncbi:MAG: hypothetical protein ABI852_10935, partial [Gemmatimonadaceae bacterium]